MSETQDRAHEWSPLRRIGFRFLFCYWVFFNIPQAGSASIFDILPWGNELVNQWLAKPMQPVAIWLGVHLFHLTGIAATFHPTGSGDTALNYVLVFLCLCLAVIATVVWTVLDKKHRQYRTLDPWLRLFVSFVVAEALVEYGFAKIFPSQFGAVSLARLNETYGESSPMGLLWTFMAGSRWYTVFGGFAETIPGLMLFFRRTRTLGALLGGTVMLNVFMLNLCYDVPVKLYSGHLLLMCVFLVWPDMAALARLFLFRGQAQLRTDHISVAERRWIRITGRVLLGLVVVCALLSVGLGAYQPYPVRDSSLPLYGQWHVDSAASTTKLVPWEEITVDRAKSMRIRTNDGNGFRLTAAVDAKAKTIAITSEKYGNSQMHYTQDAANPHKVTIEGPFNKGMIHVEMTRRSPDSYLLLTRGFHWVNEDPFNR